MFRLCVPAALSLSLVLSACSQSGPVPAGDDPYAGGVSYPWTYTAPQGGLAPLALTPGTNTLYYEPIVAARNSWGPIEIDRSNGEQKAGDGRPLTLNGVVYKKGFGTHAGSELRYILKGSGAVCTTFTVGMGVDDEVGTRGRVVFQVYLDGVKAFDSGVLTGASATRAATLDIYGKTELRLVVTDGGDGISYDHADWVEPKVTCVAAPSGTVDANFGTQGHVVTTGLGTPVAVLKDGQIVLVRRLDTRTELRRLRSSGARDTQYGSGGVLTLPASTREAVYPDGRVLLVSDSATGTTVARFTAAGRPDLTFGVAGTVRLLGQRGAEKIRVGRGEDIYVAFPDSLVRLSPAGVPDPAFQANSRPAFDLGDNGEQDIITSSTRYADFEVRPDGGAAVLVNWWGEQPRGEGTYPLSSTELRLLDAQGRVGGGGGMTDFGGVTGLQVVALTGGRVVAIGGSYMGTPRMTGMEPDIYTCRDAFGVAAGSGNTLLTFAGAYGGSGVPLCRYTAAGVLDTTFGTAGRSVGMYRAVNVLTQPDGRLVVVEADRLTRVYP